MFPWQRKGLQRCGYLLTETADARCDLGVLHQTHHTGCTWEGEGHLAPGGWGTFRNRSLL